MNGAAYRIMKTQPFYDHKHSAANFVIQQLSSQVSAQAEESGHPERMLKAQLISGNKQADLDALSNMYKAYYEHF